MRTSHPGLLTSGPGEATSGPRDGPSTIRFLGLFGERPRLGFQTRAGSWLGGWAVGRSGGWATACQRPRYMSPVADHITRTQRETKERGIGDLERGGSAGWLAAGFIDKER